MKWFPLVLIFLVNFGWGISRVGNSLIGNPHSGFQATIPFPFLDIRTYRDESIRMFSVVPGSQTGPHGEPILNFFEAKDFDRTYPELQFESPEALDIWAREQGWQFILNSNPCIKAYRRSINGTVTAWALWGPRLGIALFGPDQAQVVQSLGTTISSLELAQGACQW